MKSDGRLRIPEKLKPWIEARVKWHLSHAHVQMARELGMNPKKLGKLGANPSEKWKSPLPLFIEDCYFKQFGRSGPDDVVSIEDVARRELRRKEERRLRASTGSKTPESAHEAGGGDG